MHRDPNRRSAAVGTFSMIVVSGVLFGCTTSADPADTVTVARTAVSTDSTVAIASAAGWFEAAGLDVQVIEGRATTDVIPALLSGEVDVVYSGLSPAIATAIAEGSGVRAVAVGIVTTPGPCTSYGMVMLPERRSAFDLSDPQQLRTLRIGGPFNSGSLGLWLVDGLAAGAGLTLDDLDLRVVTSADAPATLAGDGVDALIAGEPSLTRLRQEFGAEMVVPIEDVLPQRVITALFFGPRILADPDLAARYLAVHLRAVARHGQGPTERNIAALTGPTGLEPELLADMCWAQMDPRTRPRIDAVTEAFDFAVRVGQLERSPSPEEFWDHTVQDRARALLDEWGITLDG